MAEQLKNVYTLKYIENLANKIKENCNSFDTINFINDIFDNTWEGLELKQRMRHIVFVLNKYLPFSYAKQLEVLKPVSKDFTGFEAMFFQDFVEVYGLDDFENSMKALEVFTQDSSSEFAIRQFIIKYENQTMNQMKIWAKSSNEHLRRLACEGCRPRLPWAIALPTFKENPTKVLEIIEILKNDTSKYFQKSVANNLNDISKDNPKLVIEFLSKNLGKNKSLDWICKHAARTLLKNGNKKVLELFGYVKSSHIKIIDFVLDKDVKLSEDLNFSFKLSSFETLGNVRVEYMIYYKKSNNTHNKKVFMISQNEIKTKEKLFTKKQSFKDMTTRKHYKGLHFISIVVNGEEKIKKEFNLL
ncbi:DNA alkylation repair protein [Halarcobacter sp.]|uniref:DNA alkylation repair protein n=1 Tax=Halarcobacter sp. TaxID=2321133 RepID=UPI0029F46285|nr:DNA alkylation repair protein [Halarcobacter sp.]